MTVFHSLVVEIGCLDCSDIVSCDVCVREDSFKEVMCKVLVFDIGKLCGDEQKFLVWPSLPHRVHNILSPSYSICCLCIPMYTCFSFLRGISKGTSIHIRK